VVITINLKLVVKKILIVIENIMNRPISKFAEIYGRLGTVYTGGKTLPDDFKKQLTSGNFITGLGAGNMYGPGIYSVYNKKVYNTFAGNYGSYIYKLAIDTTGFFSFNVDTISVLYPQLLKELNREEISKENFEKYVGIDNEDGSSLIPPYDNSPKVFFEDGRSVPVSKTNIPLTKEELSFRKYDPSKKYFRYGSYKSILAAQAKLLGLKDIGWQFEEQLPYYEPEHTSNVALNVWNMLYPKVRGLLFNGSRDGDVAVIYDYDSLKILSYSYFDKETGQIKENIDFGSSENTSWNPSDQSDYMTYSGEYNQKGGEEQVRGRTRKNLDIILDDEALTNSLRSNKAFDTEKEHFLKIIELKIKSEKKVDHDMMNNFVNTRLSDPNHQNVDLLKELFDKIAKVDLSYIGKILHYPENAKIFIDSYLKWRDDNRNLVQTNYFDPPHASIFSLDCSAFGYGSKELKENFLNALSYPENQKNLSSFASRESNQEKISYMLSEEEIKKLYKDNAEFIAKNYPIDFFTKVNFVPDISSSFENRVFSKNKSITEVYPELVPVAISSIKSISKLSEIGFLFDEKVPSNLISSDVIQNIKNLILSLSNSLGIDKFCSELNLNRFIFKQAEDDKKQVAKEILSYADDLCIQSAKFDYYIDGAMSKLSINEIIENIKNNPAIEPMIYIDNNWIIARDFQPIGSVVPPRQLPPLPPAPPDTTTASLDRKIFKVARLISVLKSLGINNSELKKLI